LPYKTTPTIEETFVNVAYLQLDKAVLLYADNTKNIKGKRSTHFCILPRKAIKIANVYNVD